MEREEFEISLHNLGWKQELPNIFVSKSGAVTVHTDDWTATIKVHSKVYASFGYVECCEDRQRKTISCGGIELQGQF